MVDIGKMILDAVIEFGPMVVQALALIFSGKDPFVELSKERVSQILPEHLKAEDALAARIGRENLDGMIKRAVEIHAAIVVVGSRHGDSGSKPPDLVGVPGIGVTGAGEGEK